jgi:hypothetical protein
VKKSILNRILRVLMRQHDRAADRIRPPLVQPHQRSERLAITRLRGNDERPFFGPS